MARTNFQDFTPITADFLNSVGSPRITGLDQDGHLALLNNSNFENAPGNVVYDFYRYIDALLGHQSTGGGLNFYIHGFSFLAPNGQIVQVTEQTFALPNNAISYVWFNTSGVVQITSVPPTQFGVQCALVTTGSGVIINVIDLRYDYVALPRIDRFALFGGSTEIDFVATNNQVISGLIECRNFSVPPGVTLLLADDTTVRASGDSTILGTIKTNTVQPTNPQNRFQTFGGGPNFAANDPLFQDQPDNKGNPVVKRKTTVTKIGGSGVYVNVLNGGTTQSLFMNLNINQTTVPFNAAVDGKNFTLHCAGAITLGTNSVIDLRGLNSSAPGAGSWFSATTSAGGFPPNFVWIVSMVSPVCIPGNCVLQAIRRIDVEGNASINCNGGSEGWGLSAANSGGTLAGTSTAPSYTYQGVSLTGGGYYKYGASGGGGIFMRSPVIVSAITATYSVAAGQMGVFNAASNIYLNGYGAVGNGYTAVGNIAPTAGTIQQIVSTPIEF